MSGLRKHFNMGLVLLMCALTGHCGESAPSAATPAAAAGRDAHRDFRRIVEIMKQVEENRGRHGAARTEPPSVPRAMSAPVEARDLRNLKTEREDKTVGEWQLVVWA